MLVSCDQCKKIFEISENMIFKREISKEKDIQFEGFTCPYCGHLYSVLLSDEKIRSAIQERKIIQMMIKTKYKGSTNVKHIRKLMNRDDELKKSIQEREASLKEEYWEEVRNTLEGKL